MICPEKIYPTAGNKIKIETLNFGSGIHIGENKNIESMIQRLADEVYDFAGIIDEFIPEGMMASHTKDLLFIKYLS